MRYRQQLARRVLSFIQERQLIKADNPLVVGVSGGPDSVCLVHILASLKRTLPLKLHIAHLNHLLRGDESDADADYVNSLSHELGIPASIEKRDVMAYRKQKRLSLEEAAREVRYNFFAEVARSIGTDKVAVGHTIDDQIETILMHLVRGTGLTGLRGMQPLTVMRLHQGSQLQIVRPLLEVKREETEEYCSAHELSPRSDSSNLLPDQLRNRVRSQLIPLLREYNTDIDGALLRIAGAADADLTLIDEQIARVWETIVEKKIGGIAIDRVKFTALHPALKRHLVRSALQQYLGDLQDIESVHIENIVEAMSRQAGKRLSLPRGLTFHGDYNQGLITVKGAAHCPFPALEGEHRLSIPGETEFNGWRVISSILARQPRVKHDNEFKACFDFDIVGDDLTVRKRRRGERFHPLGMDAAKKLQDFMVDARIPRHWRDRVPLVCSSQHVAWVVGWRIDQRVRITDSTTRVLCLEFVNMYDQG